MIPPTLPSPTAHIVMVEIDRDTGEPRITHYTAIDDVGKVINPMIVEGQMVGGVAQGVGQALWEHAVYDEGGQLLSGSFMDYAMPRADGFQRSMRNAMRPHHRPILWGSKAPVRWARLRRPSRWQMQLWMRWRPLACATWRCRIHHKKSGRPCKPAQTNNPPRQPSPRAGAEWQTRSGSGEGWGGV
ncbi:MAG: molybdopterin cofactor-binding domain-containing protein [Caldilineaceae bacterium]